MKKQYSQVVYSTNSDYKYERENSKPIATLPPAQQDLRVWLDKKHRGGKVACVIRDFVGSDEDLKSLASALKTLCGVGGSAKDGEIIIQGDHREKIMTYLSKHGYGAKKAGG